MTHSHFSLPPGSRCLVTGGAGFIGSNIVDHLVTQGFHTTVLDNFSTGKRENLAQVEGNPLFTLIEGDIRDLDMCKTACEGIDYVFHQGALGSVPRSIEDPVTSNNVNITGTLHMFVAAREAGVKRVVFASSSSVYGDEETLPKVEERTGKLLSPYALTKLSNEIYSSLFFDLYGFESVGLRYFNVFGRRQDPHSVYAAVIPIFVKSLLDGEAPMIFGDGHQSRDFTFVEDVIQANLRAAVAPREACGKAFNVSFGGRVYLTDLYEKICDLLNIHIPAQFGPERQGDIRHSHADITRARTLLGYEPQFSFEQGIEKTIEWYREHLS